jgi:hypothetical protein
MNHQVLEFAPFDLADGISETELLDASEALQSEFLDRQDGFLKRELVRRDERHWVDIVYWRDKEAVERAMKNAEESPVCFRYFQLMIGADHDQPGSGVLLLEQVRSYRHAGQAA